MIRIKNKIIFLWLILLLAIPSVSNAFDWDKELKRAVDSLNLRIRENELLIQKGTPAKLNFVVDLRYELHKKLNPIVDEAYLNDTLRKINALDYSNGQHIAFYILLTTLQQPILASAVNGGTDYPNLKEYLEKTSGVSDAQWVNFVNSTPGANAEKDYKDKLTKYTEAVYEKSLLGDETNKGLLLNIYSTYKINSKNYSSSILYNAVLGLGKDLRTSSIKQSLKAFSAAGIDKTTLVSNANRNLYDKNDNNAPINLYIERVKQALFKLGTVYNYGTDAQGQNLEEEETTYNMTSKIFTNLAGIDSKGVATVKENVNLTVFDYSGISGLDPNFFQKILQITDKGGGISIQDVKKKMTAGVIKIHVFITSDQNPGEYQKYARELAIAKSKEQNYLIDEYIIVGLHLYSQKPLQNGSIGMQVTILVNQRLNEKLIAMRQEYNNGLYGWFINTKTGDIIFCDPRALNYQSNAYINMEDWKSLGRNVTIEDGKQVFNNYSDNWVIYKLLSSTDDSDELFELFIFTVEAEAAIILAIPSGGASVGVFVAEQVAKSALKQAAKTAFMSVISQFAVHYFTSEKPIDEAYKDFKIDYSDLTTDVLTDVFVKSSRAKQFLVCLNGMYDKYDVLTANKINVTAFELTQGCLNDMIVFSAQEKAGPVFKKLLSMSSTAAVKALRFTKLSDDVIRKILKLVGKPASEIDAEIPPSTLKSSSNSSNPDQYSEYLDTPDNLPGDGSDVNTNSTTNKGNVVNPFKVITTDVGQALRNTISHIREINFEPKGNGYKFSGCHSKSAIDELAPNARIEVTIPANANGVYEAKVFAKGPDGIEIPKSGNGGKSTFFPDTWDEARILDEVEYAVKNNAGQVPASAGGAPNQFYGFSKDGKIKIEFYYNDATGAINSFFPSLKSY